nr:50S ribosome-binding GTPase [Oculatellaceae cyanobacterium Prado106]
QTLQELLAQAEPETAIAQKPVNILLIGRTGAGKSSLINTLFQAPLAAVDLLPSTDRIQNYQWQSPQGESLVLWDTPGYEQVDRGDFREQVLEFAMQADLLLLATPALDPALQMDVDFLQAVQAAVQEANQKSDQKSDQKSTQNLTQKWGRELPVITIVTQVDRLRPIREWQPPYDWQWGDRPKENAIREAVNYRLQQLGEQCDRVLPFVAGDPATGRVAWGADGLAIALVEAISPAKQLRLARFLRDREARALAAAQIIDHYTLQMATTQGLTALLKSPVLQFISTVSTGSPTLAYVLAERIPVEQLPVVIGKLQMAYELSNLLQPETAEGKGRSFDLRSLWGLLREIPQGEASPEVSRYAWAWGHALVEYWTQNLTADEMRKRLEDYLKR